MQKNLDISDYERIATLNKDVSSNVDVYIAKLKGNNNLNEFYIVNAFKHSKLHNETFRNFFFFYSNQNKVRDMTNFLTNDKYFFVIFKYNNYTNIKAKFSDEKNILNYPKRCEILKDILLKISVLNDMPVPAVICATNPENICIDNDNTPHITYNLEDYPKYAKHTSDSVFDNIAEIISIILYKELEEKKLTLNKIYNKPLILVVDKCRKHIYKHIPELIVDLEKAEKLCDVTDLKSAATEQLNRKKMYFKRFAKIGMGIIIAAALFFFFKPLFVNKNVPQNSPTTIGNTIYNPQNNEADKSVSVESSDPDPTPNIDYSSVSIAPGTDIPYEEYIVQYGDTLESICTSYYNNKNLVHAVSSFNGISNSSNLIVGSIIKLPNASSIEEFLPNSSESEAFKKPSNSSNNSFNDFYIDNSDDDLFDDFSIYDSDDDLFDDFSIYDSDDYSFDDFSLDNSIDSFF